MATAHQLLLAYFILRDGTPYRGRGADYHDRLHPERTKTMLTKRLRRLGWDVVLKPLTGVPDAPAPNPTPPAEASR